VAELAALLQDDPGPVVFDVRWVLGRTDGAARFAEGHLPGARYVDLDRELASEPSPEGGRHPLPSREAFQQTLRDNGVSRGSTIVIYDGSHSFGAARMWWLVRNAGLTARVLDGGYAAWVAAGFEVAVGESSPVVPTAIDIEWDVLPTVTVDEAGGFPGRGILLDARAPERFRGEVEPLDPRAGHIPGAVSAPTTANLAADGSFLAPHLLRRRFEDLGIVDGTDVAAYCGSGITASHQLLALESAGLTGTLYPGSWSQWSQDPSRPIAVGP